MNNQLIEEGNLLFDFSGCLAVEKFDDKPINGMKAVDFAAETTDRLYLVEVKDFQNPKATAERRKLDFEMLIEAGTKKKAVFNFEMGGKIKDSLLCKYALGERIDKKIVYLLFINLDNLGEFERGLLKTKIYGHIPTGLNDSRFHEFTEISFDLVNAEQLKSHGFACKTKDEQL